MQHRHRRWGGPPPQPAPHAVPTPDEVDSALKQAIRLSLQDSKFDVSKEEKKDDDLKLVEEKPSKETKAPSAQVDDEDERKPAPSKNEEQKFTVPVASEAASLSDEEDEPKGFRRDPPTSPRVIENSSFEIDAEGNGDVAAVLGATLDKVAEAIDAMNVELDRDHSSEEEEPEVLIGNDEPEIIVGDDDTADSSRGTEIVGGEEEDKPFKDDASTDSWVVADDEQAALARAAQVIGSALLNSDMAQSAEHGSIGSRPENVAGSGASASSGVSFLSVGSIPTSVPSVESHVAQAQAERWASQLSQLHELGFEDDDLLVETIERLDAANIGCSSTDEVTVEQVVNELMKGK